MMATSFLDVWLPRLRDMPASERPAMRARLNSALARTDLPVDGRLHALLLLGALGALDDGFQFPEVLRILDATLALGQGLREIRALPQYQQEDHHAH